MKKKESKPAEPCTHADEADAQAIEILETRRENLELKMQQLQTAAAEIYSEYVKKWEAMAVKYAFDPMATTLNFRTREFTRKG